MAQDIELMGNLFRVDPRAPGERARVWSGKNWTPHFLTNEEISCHRAAHVLTDIQAEIVRAFGTIGLAGKIPPATPGLA